MTYHAYKDTKYLFDLIGEVDSKGELVPGDPNLNPRHQKQAVQNVAPVDSGLSLEQKQAMKDELVKKFSKPEKEEEPIQRKKPGPKPKVEV